jgi:DNA-binding IclR family transcriptional regulator
MKHKMQAVLDALAARPWLTLATLAEVLDMPASAARDFLESMVNWGDIIADYNDGLEERCYARIGLTSTEKC